MFIALLQLNMEIKLAHHIASFLQWKFTFTGSRERKQRQQQWEKKEQQQQQNKD